MLLTCFPIYRRKQLCRSILRVMSRRKRTMLTFRKLRRVLWLVLFRAILSRRARASNMHRGIYRRRSRAYRIMTTTRAASSIAFTNSSRARSRKLYQLYESTFFLRVHYDMSIPDFVYYCKQFRIYNGSLSSVMSLLDIDLFTFIARHFMYASRDAHISVNSTIHISGYRAISVGDIIEFSTTGRTIYSDTYVLLFNMLLFCRMSYVKTRLFHALMSLIRP